jgi:hypothetical protein
LFRKTSIRFLQWYGAVVVLLLGVQLLPGAVAVVSQWALLT